MTARVFISDRSSDGTEEATARARELDAPFGPAAISVDGGGPLAGWRWRDQIRSATDGAPISRVDRRREP